jgi:raffinose/stachyose/melibiose transport system permease protein
MKKWILHLTLSIIIILHLIPIVSMLINSLRSNESIKIKLFDFPRELLFQNYADTWIKGEYLIAFRNTFIIDIAVVLIVLVVNGLASYGLTKLNVYGKSFLTGYFVAALSIPPFAFIVPLYFMFQKIGLVNNLTGIILIYAAISIPFNLLIMRAFFIGIPRELEEAAKIDGCSEMGSIRYITLPLAKPILTTVALIVFVNSYNEFLFANTFLQDDNIRTVALRFFNFVGKYQSDLAYVFASGCITLIPIIILYLFLQRSFIEGMTQGGLKG